MRRILFRRMILIIAALLFVSSCGIPRMFSWDNNEEYQINSSRIRFNLSYIRYDSAAGQNEEVQLTPKDGAPKLNFYYAIGSTTGLESKIETSLSSAYSSRYSNAYPPSRQINDQTPIASATATISASKETTSVGLYEFKNEDGIRPGYLFDINDYYPFSADAETGNITENENLAAILENYDKCVTYSLTTVEHNGGYAIELTLFPELPESDPHRYTFTLVRNNGLPFRTSIDSYIGKDDGEMGEFTAEDDNARDFITPAIYVFVSCTFIFDGYTTVRTIPLTMVGNAIELSTLGG